MMTAYIRFAALNPYWYVPPDLARRGRRANSWSSRASTISTTMGYEVLSDWTPGPEDHRPQDDRLEGACVDGKVEVMIRQKPGPKNFMGRMKFMFPNQFGVYLHDNPRRELFKEVVALFQRRLRAARGCVRGSSRWLFGRDLDLGRRRGPRSRCRWRSRCRSTSPI